MKTELQSNLAKICPNVSIRTIWTHDEDANFKEMNCPGGAFEGELPQDWQAWQSEICATAIFDGERIQTSAYLGGTWERAGDNPAISNPDISGYERQMTEEALEFLLKDSPLIGHNGSAEFIREQIKSALQYLSTLT